MSEIGDAILREQLDDEQLAVAAITERNLLVLAPPGSGKTRVLVNAAAHRARHASELVGYGNARIMCLTFGNDAATEMRERLKHRPLSVPPNRMWVGNYHGLATHLLRRYGHHLGWPRDAGLLPAPANEPVLAEAISELGIRGLKAADASNAISALKGRRAVDDDDGTLQRLRRRYDEILAERQLRDYDDLILHARDLLKQSSGVRRIVHDAYPFLFVDELQDTNLLQLDLLNLLVGENTRVFAVADDDQMIYGWRDAHPENIDEFVDRFDAEEVPLVGNYRCPPHIVTAANQIIVLNDRRREVVMESRVKNRDGEVIVLAARTTSESEIAVGEVQRALKEGVPLGDIAILAPHHFKLDDVASSLNDHGIRYVHAGRSRLANAPVVRLLQLALRCVAGGTIVSTDTEQLATKDSPDELADAIRTAAETASVGSPRGLVNRLLKCFSLGTGSHPNRDADNIRLFARMARKAVDDGNPSTPAELAEGMIRDWDRLERAALRAEEAVKVMTSFTAKGTEYQVVILPFLNDGLIPYKRRREEIDWQEARRVFYVALTRTKHRVVLIYDAEKEKSVLLESVETAATESHTR